MYKVLKGIVTARPYLFLVVGLLLLTLLYIGIIKLSSVFGFNQVENAKVAAKANEKELNKAIDIIKNNNLNQELKNKATDIKESISNKENKVIDSINKETNKVLNNIKKLQNLDKQNNLDKVIVNRVQNNIRKTNIKKIKRRVKKLTDNEKQILLLLINRNNKLKGVRND